MNFEFSQDQQMLQESISRVLLDNYDFAARQKTVKSDQPYSQKLWQTAAELGWLSLPFSEDDGGFGGNPIDTMLLFLESGKRAVVEPFLETLVLGGGLLKQLAEGEQRGQIEKIINGELQCALALTGEVKAQSSGDGYVLNGSKSVVYNAPCADLLLVTAQLNNELAVYVVPSGTDGLVLEGYSTVDGRCGAELTLNNVSLPTVALLGQGDRAETALQKTIDEALLMACAELTGMAQTMVSLTVEYTRERKQFGVPISSFQVLQHKMVDMYMEQELMTSLLYAAAIKLRDATEDAGKFIAALKVKCDKSARFVAQQGFQCHGGMATTDEYAIGHYLKRVVTISQMLGGTSKQLQRYIRS